VRPGTEDGDSLGQEAVAMDLRRRSKNYVVEAIADEALLAIGQESALSVAWDTTNIATLAHCDAVRRGHPLHQRH
jgi:hypothetical protein